MASSWFKGLSSILSRKSKKKLVIEKPFSRFSRYLALERLEDRLNLANTISFSAGGVLTATIADDARNMVVFMNNGNITFTDQTIGGSAQWLGAGGVSGATASNPQPGVLPTSVTVALNSAFYAPGTLTGVTIASNSTNNTYSFGLANTISAITAPTIAGTGYIAGSYVTIGTAAPGRVLATAFINNVTAGGGAITSLTLVNGGSGYDPFASTLLQPITPINGATGGGATTTITLSVSNPLDFSTLNATNVNFTFSGGGAGIVNSINYNEYIKTAGTGSISITAGSGTGNVSGLSGIVVTTPGLGYSASPTVSFVNPAPLASVTASTPGTGYTLGDTVTIQPRLTSVAISPGAGGGGSGYTTTSFPVTLTDGTGAVTTVASGTAYTVGGVITSVTLTTVGFGYVNGNTYTVAGGTFTTQATVVATVPNPAATGTVTSVNGGGGITGINLATFGVGYINGFTYTVSGGTGNNAQVTASVVNTTTPAIAQAYLGITNGTITGAGGGGLAGIGGGGSLYQVGDVLQLRDTQGNVTLGGLGQGFNRFIVVTKATPIVNGAGGVIQAFDQTVIPNSILGVVVTTAGAGYRATTLDNVVLPTVLIPTNGNGVGAERARAVAYLSISDNAATPFDWTTVPTNMVVGTGNTAASNQVQLVESFTSTRLIPGGTGYDPNSNAGVPNTAVVFTGGGFTTAATATATVSPSGVITAINLTGGGTGYQTPPIISFTGGGSGAQATAVINAAGVVTSLVAFQSSNASATATYQMQNININNTGVATPTAVFGTGALANSVISISGGTLATGGGGNSYVPNRTDIPLTFTPTSGGTGAVGFATTNNAGNITGYTITNVGTGYMALPTVTIAGRGAVLSLTSTGYVTGETVELAEFVGTGAALDTAVRPLVIAAGKLSTTIAVGINPYATTSPGTGYVTAPIVTITGGGATTNATAIATLGAGGTVASITITNGGLGYTGQPTVTIQGSTLPQTRAQYTVVASSALQSTSTIFAAGAGYTNTDTVTILGGALTSVAKSAAGAGYTAGAVTILGNTLGPVILTAANGGTATTYVNGETVTIAGGTTVARGIANVTAGAITSVTITSVGIGYTDGVIYNVTGGSGAGATVTAVVANATATITVAAGAINTITATSFPGGFISGSTYTVLQGANVTGSVTATANNAVGIASVTAGGITSIAYSGFGSGYVNGNKYFVINGTGGGPSNLNAQISAVAGSITSLTATNILGSGYSRTSQLFVIPTSATSAGNGGQVDTIGAIATLALNAPTTNFPNGKYKDLATLNIYQGLSDSTSLLNTGINTGGRISAYGSISQVLMTYNGANYTTTPVPTFLDPQDISTGVNTAVGGVRAVGVCILSTGSPTGDGYTYLTGMNVIGGSGTNANFSATGFVTRVAVTTVGSYPNGTPLVTFTTRAATAVPTIGAAATATVGVQLGSTISVNPVTLGSTGLGTNAAMITTGSGGITLDASNEFSFISIDQPIVASGAGSIRMNAGYRPSEGYAVRLNADITTNTGNIVFYNQAANNAAPPSPAGLVSTSAVLLAGVSGINLNSTSGSIFFSSTLDAVSRQDIQFNTSGNVSIFGNIGTISSGLGDIILGNDTISGNGINSLWFNGALIAESLTVNNASSYVRNGAIASGAGFTGVLIVGKQTYNNEISLLPTIDLRTANGGNITMQGQISAVTANNTDGEMLFTTSSAGKLSLLTGLSTTGNLTISGVTSIDLGNISAGIGANDITISVGGSNGLTFNDPFNLIGNVTLAVATTKDITLNKAVEGGNDLHFAAPAGDITVGGTVGLTTPLRNIILDSSAASLTFNGATLKAGGLSTNGNFVSGNIDLSIPTIQIFNGVTTLILQASGNILLNAMNLSGTANIQIDNNNSGILELRGSITNVNSQFLQQRASGGTAGASGAVAGVKIGTSSGLVPVSITGTNTGGTSIQFQGSEIGRVTNIVSIVSGGSGYQVGDLLSVSGVSAPGTVAATVTVTATSASSILNSVTPGVTTSAYATSATFAVTIGTAGSGGVLTAATGTATTDGSGAITGITINSGGSGYVNGNTYTVNGGTGASTVTAIVLTGGITAFSAINNPTTNFGYNINSLTGISLVGGSGTGAVVNAYGVSDTFVDLLSSTTVTTLSGGNITFFGRLESTNAKSFTVSSVSGNLTFKDDVGLADGGRTGFPLASFTASTGGIGRVIFSDESNGVATSGLISITGNSTISNSSVFTAGPGNISFTGDLSGTTVGSSDLTFRNTGSISVGSLGQGTNGTLKDVLIDGNAASFATSVATGSSGGIKATSFKTGSNIVVQGAIAVVGSQTYGNVAGTNDVALSSIGNIVMNTQDITSVGNLSLTSSAGNISLRAVTGTGDAIFSHNVGTLNLEGNLFARSFSEAASSAAVNIGATTTVTLTISTGDVAFNSGVVLINDAIITTASNSNVSFQRTLKGGATNTLRNLNFNNAGNVAFVGSVGGSGSVAGTAERIGNITIGSSSLFGLSASGTDFKAASLVTTNPVLGNVSLTSTLLDLTGSAGLNLATNNDGHVVSLAKNTGGAGYSVGDILDVGTGAFTTVATVQVLAVTAGSIDSFKILTAGTGYTNGGSYTLLPGTGSGTGATVTVTSNVSSNIALGVTNLNSTGGLTLTSSTAGAIDTVTLTGNITSALGIAQNGSVDVTLGTTSAITITTAASSGAIFAGNLVVAQNTQMNVGGGITITGTINSVDSNNIRSLGLQSTIGIIGINSEIGATNALLSFTANAGAAGTVTIQDLSDTSVTVLTQSGINITGNLNLVEADTTLDGGTGGNITLAGNVSGFASSDLVVKTSGGAISVTGATGIGTSSVRMGEIVIDGTPASLQITGNIYADSISTINNLAAAISVTGSQFITNNVKLYSNNGPVTLGAITTDNGGLLTAVAPVSTTTPYATSTTIAVTITGGLLTTVAPLSTTIAYATSTTFNVTITGAGVVTPATGTATTDAAGNIISIAITLAGSGYVNGNTYTVTSAGAGASTVTAAVAYPIVVTPATGIATTDGAGNIININITSSGSGYVNGGTYAVTGGTGASTVTATVASNIDIEASTGAVTVGALNAGVNAAGAINIKHGSTLTLNNNITAGSFTETVGSIGNIVVGNATPVTFQVSGTNSGFQFLNSVQLKQNLIILSNSNVLFNGTVDTQTGSASKNLAITVQSGTSKDVTFSGAVGGTSGVAMGDITIGGAVAINAGTNTITALSLDATATGVITLKGVQTYSGSSGLKLTANGDIFVGTIVTSNSGNVSLNNKNALNILGNITSAGSINQVTRTGGASLVTFGDTNSANTLILQSTTTGLPVSFDASMVLNKDVQFKSVGTGSITAGTGGSANLAAFTLANGGAGYTASSTFAVSIGTVGSVVTAATGNATTDGSGAIISIVITSAGSGYVTGNNYTVVGGTGTITTPAIVTATGVTNPNTTIKSGVSGSYNLLIQATGGALINLNSDIGGTNAENLASLTVATVSASGGKTNIASRTIKTGGVAGQTFTGNVDYSNALILSSGSGPITFNSQLDSTNAANLTLTSNGALSFQAIGSSNKVGDILITAASNGLSGTSINAASLKTGTGIALIGNILITGIQTYTSDIDIDTAAGISMGNSITSNTGKIDLTSGGTTSVSALTTLNAGAGTITLSHGATLTLLGNILSGNSFTETATQSTNILVGSGGASPVTITVGSGNFSIGLTNVTQLLLNNDLQVTTSGAGADVTFGSVIDSAASAAKGIAINTTGDIIFGGNIGQANLARLGAISLSNNASSLTATNVNIKAGSFTTGASTAVKGAIDLSGTIDLNAAAGLTLKTDITGGLTAVVPVSTTTPYATLTTFAVTITGTGVVTPATGTATTDGVGAITSIAITSPGSGYVNGNTYTVTSVGAGASTVTAITNGLKLGPVITINGGNVVLTHSGLLTLLGDVIANGNITETATGSSTPGVEIGNTTISGTVTLNSNPANGFISLSRPVTLNQSLAIQASGNGNIAISTVDAGAGLTKDLTITILGATGVVTLGGSLGAGGALTKVQVNAGASGSIGINGAVITTIGASGQSFTALNTNYTSALTLTAGSGPIAFVGGLNSSTNADLTLATIGALSFGGAVGAGGALGNIDTTLASSGLTATTISAKSFDTNVALAGPISITGAQTYTDATSGFLKLETTGTSNMAMTSVSATNGGINLKTAQGTISVGALTASDTTGGDIALNHGGNLTLNGNIIAGDTLVITSGLNTLISVGTIPGAAILIDVNNSDVAFGTNVDLVQNLTIQNRNSKDVIFNGFLDSSNTTKNLSISTTGDVSFVKTVGQIAASRLGDISISNGASSLTASADVNAKSMSSGVVAGTALASFVLNGGTGYAVTPFAVTITGTGVVTAATGTATTNPSGVITSIAITSAGSGYVTGNTYTVVGGTGTGASVLATANGAINFAGTQNYAGASGLTLATTGVNGDIIVNGVTTTLGAVNFTNSKSLSLLGNISSFGQIKQVAGTGGTVAVTTGVTTNNTQLTFNSTNSGLDFATSISTNQDSQFSSSTNGLIDIRSSIFSDASISRKLTVSNVNGTINFGGDIGSAANDFSQVVISAGVTGIINLAGAKVITTGSSGQSFTAGSTNYTTNLTLDAGSGSIGFVGGLNSSNSKNLNLTNTGTLTFNGAVGAVGALGDIRITGASNGLTATGISAKSLETGAGFALIGPISITGTQTYSNNLKLETAGTNNISVGVVNTTTGSIVLLTDQGSLNVGALTASASTINLTHGGTLTFAGDIFAGTTLVVNSTNGSAIIVGTGVDIIMRALAGGISLTGPVSLVNNLSATAGNGAINFGSTINSAAGKNLTLSLTLANTVTFGGAIGQTFRLGDISITGAPAGIDATTKNISAKSFVASASSGLINLRGTLDFNGANGFNVTTTGQGLASVAITSTSGVGYTASSSFAVNLGTAGLGGVVTAATGTATTNGSGAITSIVITSAGSGYVTGNTYTVVGGTGTITTAAIVTATATTGNITLGQLTTSAGAVLISNSQILQLLGNVLSSGSITESGAGTVLLGDLGAVSPTITVSTTTAGSGIVFGKNITLNRDGVLTAAGAGNVTLSGTVDSEASTPRGLTLNSGSGVISLNANVGTTKALASVNATTTGNISLGGTNVTTVGNGGQKYSGLNTSFTNDLVLSAATGNIGFVGTLTSGTKNLTLTTTGGLSFGGAVSGLGDILVNAASAGLSGTSISATSLVGATTTAGTTPVALNGAVSITGQQNYTDRLVLATSGVNNIGVAGVNTTTGPITLTTNLGTLNVGSLIATANAVSLTHGGTLTIGGNIFAGTTLGVTTNNGATIVVGTGSNVSMQALAGGISLGGAVTLVNDLTVSASGAVAFGNTLNSTAGQRRALSISTTNNSVTFSGAVGQVVRLGAISIAGTPTGIDAGTKNISASSFVNTGAASGTINIQGTQNYDGAVGLNLLTTGAGGNITLGQVTTTAGGVTLTNSNLLTLLGNVSSFGTILQQAGTGGGTPTLDIGVTSNGTVLNIQTTNAGSAIDIGSATKLNQSATLVAAGNGSVDVRSTVNSNTTTARSLNISNTGGTITMAGAIGTASIAPSSALSLIVLNAGAAGTINLNGGAITTSTSAGQIYTGSINLGNADLTLTANGTGVLTFNGNTNGTQNLTMKTAGAINFNGNVGANNPLGDMFIDAANPSGFTITGTVNASSLQNINSSFVNGNISITSAQNYSVGGLVLVTQGNGSITVGNITSGGSSSTVSFTHQGNLNLQGNINDSGSFAQTGTSGGTVFIGNTLPTTIQIGSFGAAFNRAVTLNRSLSLIAPGDISFAQNLNSAVGQTSNLTLNSSGILSFASNVGNTTALGVIDASNATLTGITATNVNAVIKAQSFNSGFVAGNINLTTPQTYSTAAGLNLTTVVPGSGTSDITLGAVTTSNGGVVNIQNVDSLKLQGTLTLDGAFTQTNNDLSSINEDVEFGAVSGISFSLTTTGDNISFEAPILMNQNSLLSTGATGLGVVTLSSSVNSSASATKNLTVTNANGTANIGGSLGTANNAELGLLSITSNAINFTDNLSTTTVKTKGSSGQSYNGTVSLSGDVVMNAGNLGPVSFSSTIDSAPLATKSLTLQGVNSAQLNGNIGASNPLSSFSISGTSSALTTFNAGSVTTIGSGQTYNTALLIGNVAPGQINLTAGSGNVVFGNTVGLTSRNLTVAADEIDINSTIDPSSTGVSVLILQAGNTSTPVVIAGTPVVGTLDLTSAELLNLVNGFKSITIGNANSLGNLTVAADLTSSQIRDPFTLTTSGNMLINGAIAAVDNATLSLVDPNYATATITLANAISTQGNVITIDGATQVNTGGAIATTGTGSSNPLGADIKLLANSRFTGTGTLTLDSGSVGLIVGNNTFNMSGGLTITNSGGATFNQGVTAGAVNINGTTSGKDVVFNGTLNATSFNTANGAYNIKVLSGGNITGATVLNNTGTTTLGDAAIDTLTFAGGLTATGSSKLSLAGTIATTNNAMTLGNSDLTTNTILQSGSGPITTGSVTGGANIKLSLQNNLATGAVNLAGNVTVNQLETFAGVYAVNLTGSNNVISGSLTTFLNTGGITFGDSTSDVSTFTNGLTAIASAVNLAGIVATTNSAMNLGAVNLSLNGTVKSGSGTITIASVSGAANKLSLQDNTANSRGLVVVNGTVNINQIETFAQNYAVSLLGTTTVSSASTFNNTGATTFGDGGNTVDTVTFAGGLTAKAGAVNLNSRLVTTNNLLDIGAVTLAGNSTLQSGTGTITVGSITDGANSYTLNLQDGSGSASQGSVIFSGDVNVSAISTAAKIYAVSFQANTTIDSPTTFTNLAGVSFGKNASSLTTFTNGVTAIAGTGNFILAGTLKTTGQPINIGNSGVSINLVDSTIIDSGNSSSATISINSAISTNGRSLTLSSGSTAGGTISVNSIDSTAGGLTIANAGGQVTFAGNVGASTGSGLITITNSQQGVEFQGQLFGSNVNIVNTAPSKTIKFGGNLTLTGSIVTTQQNYNVDISGSTNVIGAANNFNNLGTVNINNASTPGTTTFTNGFGVAFPAAVNVQGTIVANGQVNISKPVNVNGTTTTTFNNTSNTISGVVTGSAAITSNGIGTLSLTGNSTGYTGTINANAGNVAVNANFSNASANVGAVGKISGIGSLGTLTANGGVVAPGNSPGTLTVGTATLGATGAQATYNVEINGASAGQFDQIKVNSSATLANAVLSITAGGSLQVGQQFQIVSGTTTGQFSNAVSTISTGNTVFSVTYNASGVLLTVTSVTPTPTPTPSPSPTPSPTPAPTPTPPAPSPTPSPTPTPAPTGPYVLFATGADAGGGPEVRVNFTNGTSVSFFAYDMAYRGGVRVTMGDLNGDGTNEIITGTGPGGGPNIRVFNVTSSGGVTMVANFFAFEPQFMGGVYVAAGNLNGDVSSSGKGIADLIVSAGPGGGPRVIAYSGGANYVNLNNQLCDYFVYAPSFTGGVSVAAGNVVGAANSSDELITGAGPGGGPHVRAFVLSNTNTPNSVLEYMAFDPAIRNGIYVGAGDLDNDGYDEIFTGTNSAPSLPTMVNVRYGNGNQAVVYPFGEFTGGARVGVAKDNNNNQYMVVGAGPGGGPLVQIYNRNLIAIDSLFAFPLNFTGGVFTNTSIS